MDEKKKPLKAYAIINNKGELVRLYRGDSDKPWIVKCKNSICKEISMLLPGDTVIELNPINNIDVIY